MKKQIKKLSLSKRTISNLNLAEMNRFIGRGTYGCETVDCSHEKNDNCGNNSKNCTQNQNTCPGHKTC